MRWAQHGAIRVAATGAGLWLLWKYGFLSRDDENVNITLRSASDLLLLGSALPIARVLSSHAESLLSGHYSLTELPSTAPRSRRDRRRLETRPKRLEITGLKHRYGDKLVVDVPSLELDLERPVLVMGENGAGKTTLAAVLGGVIDGSEGRVALDGVDARVLAGDDVAFVPQYPLSVLDLSVLENAQLVAPECSAGELGAVLDELGFTRACTTPMRALSRGEQQRVAIARALAKRPKLLILDEPDAWLDGHGRQLLAGALSRRTDLMSMLIVTHRDEFEELAGAVLDLGETGAACQRVRGVQSGARSSLADSGESTA
jgi:ABC-type Mn2+/Zn2+ transport system ATPase subunit